MEKFELREIPGYSGIYMTREPQFISTIGKTRILDIHNPVKTMRYSQVYFYSKSHRVHQLVAEVFPELVQGEPGEGKELDHINGNRADNRPENLRWVSHYENMNNPITIENFKKSRRGREKVVYQYTKSGICIEKYNSAAEAGELTGIASNEISMVASGTRGRHTAGGFVWKYE